MTNIHGVYCQDLDHNVLRVFAVVAKEGSITRAALRLYLTQAAVSSAMRRLTSFVGTELFVRQGRRGARKVDLVRGHRHQRKLALNTECHSLLPIFGT
jgi:hypothetical protein